MRCPHGTCLAALLVMLGRSLVFPGMIDFETINGSVPFEGMAISNQFRAYYGVTFRSPGGDFPALARVGWPEGAFDRNGDAESDTVQSSQANAIGNFYLSHRASGTNVIIMDFDGPVSQVRGYTLDIDNNETLTILAYGDSTSTNPLQTLVLTTSTPNTGDGIATSWSLVRPTPDIRRVELVCKGPMGHDLLYSNYMPPPAEPAVLELRLYPGLTIQGSVGRPYRIDYADKLDRTDTSTNWHALTTIFLPTSPYLFMDRTSASTPERYYRAEALQ